MSSRSRSTPVAVSTPPAHFATMTERQAHGVDVRGHVQRPVRLDFLRADAQCLAELGQQLDALAGRRRRDAFAGQVANAGDLYIGESGRAVEHHVREYHRLHRRIHAVDVRTRIGLGVAQPDRLGERRGEVQPGFVHAPEDVIRRSVQHGAHAENFVPERTLLRQREHRQPGADGPAEPEHDPIVVGQLAQARQGHGQRHLVDAHDVQPGAKSRLEMPNRGLWIAERAGRCLNQHARSALRDHLLAVHAGYAAVRERRHRSVGRFGVEQRGDLQALRGQGRPPRVHDRDDARREAVLTVQLAAPLVQQSHERLADHAETHDCDFHPRTSVPRRRPRAGSCCP